MLFSHLAVTDAGYPWHESHLRSGRMETNYLLGNGEGGLENAQ